MKNFSIKRSRTSIYNDFLDNLLLKYTVKKFRKFEQKLIIYSRDYVGAEINIKGTYEGIHLDFLFLWFKSIGIDFETRSIIDVGANIGNHSVYFSKHCLGVFGFEPNPDVYYILKKNIERYGNIEVFNLGLSDKKTRVPFVYDTLNIGASKIVGEQEKHDVFIDVVKLDDYFFNKKIGLIKIDVEGHELEVIDGAINTIKSQMPIILFEINSDSIQDGKSIVIERLKMFGYHSFYYIEDKYFFKNRYINFLCKIIFGGGHSIRSLEKLSQRNYSFVIALEK